MLCLYFSAAAETKTDKAEAEQCKAAGFWYGLRPHTHVRCVKTKQMGRFFTETEP